MTRSVRMLRRNRGYLHRYVFADLDHARSWLKQAFVNRDEITLEYVEVGESTRCPRCKGSGYTAQSIKAMSRLTVDEFLRDVAL